MFCGSGAVCSPPAYFPMPMRLTPHTHTHTHLQTVLVYIDRYPPLHCPLPAILSSSYRYTFINPADNWTLFKKGLSLSLLSSHFPSKRYQDRRICFQWHAVLLSSRLPLFLPYSLAWLEHQHPSLSSTRLNTYSLELPHSHTNNLN